MRIGISIFPTDYAIRPAALGRAVEEREFDSLFVCEHSHIPLTTAEETGRPVVDDFSHTFDPFVALTAIAAATSTIRIGTSICLVVQRDPIHLAKEVASVDVLSGGRLVMGVGGGWNFPEMRNHGTAPRDRWRLLEERVRAMRAIWADDVAEFHGEFVDFGPMWQWPKPTQRPAPPVLVGGVGAGALDRVVAYGDGWIPRVLPVEDLRERVTHLRKLADAAGRPVPSVTVFSAPPDADTLAEYEELGIDEALLHVPSADTDETCRVLDDYALLRS